MKISVFLICIVITNGYVYATKGLSPKIMGGTETDIESYPFLAVVELQLFDIWYMQWCGGTLLTTTTVLSAAHCFRFFAAQQFRVRLGSSYVLRDGTEHFVNQIVSHPSYQDDTFDGDVSVLQLASPAQLGESVARGIIAGGSLNVPDDSPVMALGWGELYAGGPAPEKLHHVEVYTINQDLCKHRYNQLSSIDSRFFQITSRMLCAGIIDVGGQDACAGDSGGPIVYRDVNRWVVIGVNSWGYTCGDPHYPGVYARVSAVSDWIVSSVLSLSYI